MNDVPLQRQIKIGRASIGLDGLDVALSRALGGQLSRREALEQIFQTIVSRNYIPSGMRDTYREALAGEYDRLRGSKTGNQDKTLTIRILGPGCVSCNNIQKLVVEIMAAMQVKADICQIHDLDEIGRMGVMQTPALVINGQLKATGRLPARFQIEEWLREAIGGD